MAAAIVGVAHEDWCSRGALAKGGLLRRVCCPAHCGICNQPRCYVSPRPASIDGACCLQPTQRDVRTCANASDTGCVIPKLRGFTHDIAREYDLAWVNMSAGNWSRMRNDPAVAAALRMRHARARTECHDGGGGRDQHTLMRLRESATTELARSRLDAW